MDPATATFTSMDSYAGNIYEPASLHRYLYANANPVKYCDPSGHSQIVQVMAAVSIKVILSAAVTSCIMGVIGGIVSAGYAIVKGGDGRQVVSAFIDGFKSGAKIGAYLGALTAFVSYCFSISIIKASTAVALSHDGAIALSEFVIERDAKKLAKRVPFILLDIVFFRAAWISEAKSFLPGYDGHKGSISEYNNNNAGYLDEGSRTINGLEPNQGYKSFNDLKKAIGSAGERKDWHHIVEQSQIEKSGFSPEQIHNTDNIIAVDHATHMKITGYYNTKSFDFTNGLSVRDWLAGQSYEEQYSFGLDVLRRFGVIE